VERCRRGISRAVHLSYQDETLRLGLPFYGANQLAIDRIGPTIILLGTDAQKKRFLPHMLTADELWRQRYSGPNAGSDLAHVQTRAVLFPLRVEQRQVGLSGLRR
jgi:alkylation response protein AidB-like acyl-CoA dehydrogenase